MANHAGNDFLESIPPFADFRQVANPEHYRPLPDGWLIGAADIVNSTQAIADGRYKSVNTVGASVISAVMNLNPDVKFPFVFGGDGASFAVSNDRRGSVGDALAACRIWSEEEIRLTLRAALIPIADIRAAGHNVQVARFSPSPHVTYAMFAGGGIAWADAQMKAGKYEIAAAPAGTRPDLAGLSCRWKPIASRKGEIVSLLIAPGADGATEQFETLIEAIRDLLAGAGSGGGSPLAPEGPTYDFPPRGLDIEARASAGTGSRWSRWARYLPILAEQFVPIALQFLKTRSRNFDPAHYRAVTALNSDFRKFDDGLKMTIDCAAETVARLEAILGEAHSKAIANYGLHRQDNALMTCIVPSPLADDHMHFIDGAAGGYAMAAAMLKKMMAEDGSDHAF
jgi:hypothetical protein